MKKRVIETVNAPKPVGPYSQAVEIGGMIYCSGQVPINPETEEVLQAGIGVQTRRVMDNIKAVLEASDCTMGSVIKSTIFLTDMGDFNAVNEVYSGYFTDAFPARSCVEVSALPKGVNVEIEVIAAKR